MHNWLITVLAVALIYSCLQYDLVHISVGDLLREQVAQGTPAGEADSSHMALPPVTAPLLA